MTATEHNHGSQPHFYVLESPSGAVVRFKRNGFEFSIHSFSTPESAFKLSDALNHVLKEAQK